MTISEKTRQDLQFPTILEAVSAYCVTQLGKEKAAAIQPFDNKGALLEALQQTADYLSSFSNQNAFPNHGFDDISQHLHLLAIDGSYVEPATYRQLANLVTTSTQFLNFLKKYSTYYPALYKTFSQMPVNKEVVTQIDAVIDKFDEVKDQASPRLAEIRRNIAAIRGKVNQSFGHALNHYHQLGYLDDIRESIVQNRRVLAVLSMYRRKVKGQLLGNSKTGSITYIEPETTLIYSNELSALLCEEQEEIIRILKRLATTIRPDIPLLDNYQDMLSTVDMIAAKAYYARSIQATLPNISTDQEVYLRDAFHPILLRTNAEKKQPVYPQTIALSKEKRIIVISGPNAGGKTIALKTVGLLQLMLQSGLLVPVHERSTMCIFDAILTDIGDNQSVENHLSTYSYRLKNMRLFLRKCNSKTLFLIDEFGTGSDPELGGALAETFLEEFYHREAFGIITTHYANLKMLANELPNATNANMLFDEHSLEPKYQLIMGQAGSSFTFEVAQKNGIPYGLINRAKKKIENGKIRFDKTIASLQKERSRLEKTALNLKEEEQKAREENQRMEEINHRIKQKLESYQELYDDNQRTIYLGKKINELAQKYALDKNKKAMIAELLKVIEIENAKRKKTIAKATTQQAAEKQKAQIIKELDIKLEEIRREKKEKKQKLVIEKKPTVFKKNDRVRISDGKAVGILERIEKGKATVNYGLFTTQVNISDLELVEKVK